MTVKKFDLERVTYVSLPSDLEPHHRMFDRELPEFRKGLGGAWPNRIGGSEVSDGEAFTASSPIDSELILGSFVEASSESIAHAVASARKAATEWGALPWRERVEAVRRIGRKLDAMKYDLALAVMFEVGKTRMEALGETEEAVALLDYYCDEMERNAGFVSAPNSAMAGESSQTLLRPLGVVAVICPFNYPVALSVNMASAALVAGNAVVVKPSPAAGLTGGMLGRIFDDGDLPRGTFNLVCGAKAGARLVEEPGVDGFAFTGSHDVGMAILRKIAAGPYMRPVMAEMGGKNPAYVALSADPLVAAEGIARSAFGFQGQKCTACSIAFVHEDHYAAVLADILERTGALKIGDPTVGRGITNGPVINQAAIDRYRRAAAHAAEAGKIRCGGDQVMAGDLARGNFLEPMVITDVPEDDWLLSTELFAPVLTVLRFSSLEDAIARGNRVKFGLAAGFYGKGHELDLFLDRAAAGVLYANRRTGATTGAWPGIQSFCGWKGSGLTGKGGLGPHYLPQFMREQSLTVRTG
ncbi:MAG: aldehyde dehydrogenase family protein [Hyphomicrobiaceae bacterium]|nr:aldehyde dehydrogenase family protein [Hyphomicrobiaceae bacterium]